MPKYTVRDEAGNRLGAVKLPDGLTADEVKRQVAKARQTILATKAIREAERCEPATNKIRCSGCDEGIEADRIAYHVQKECPAFANKPGVDL